MRKSIFCYFDSLLFLSLLTVNVDIIFPPVHMQSVNKGNDIYINPMCSNTNMSMFLLPISDTLKFRNVCHIFSCKEHASFQLAILQHIQKSYVFKQEHAVVPIFDISEFEISYSSTKFIPILNSLFVIFHRPPCKFGGNLVSKLGLKHNKGVRIN